MLPAAHVGRREHVVCLHQVAQSAGYHCVHDFASSVEQRDGTVCFGNCVIGFSGFAQDRSDGRSE
jgi:hypothetical protein